MRQPSNIAVEVAERVFRAHAGVMTTSEVLAAGIHRRTLYGMRDEGILDVLSRGVFVLASASLPASPDVAAVMLRAPRAVLCLVSALDLHGIGTRIPHSVQIALPRDVRAPRIRHPRIEVFHMAQPALGAGIELREMAGRQLQVFGVAKTVADCFAFRNRIGIDVAIEALQEVIRGRLATPAEIMRYAKIDRVHNVMRPYLQALL